MVSVAETGTSMSTGSAPVLIVRCAEPVSVTLSTPISSRLPPMSSATSPSVSICNASEPSSCTPTSSLGSTVSPPVPKNAEMPLTPKRMRPTEPGVLAASIVSFALKPSPAVSPSSPAPPSSSAAIPTAKLARSSNDGPLPLDACEINSVTRSFTSSTTSTGFTMPRSISFRPESNWLITRSLTIKLAAGVVPVSA